ncbi:hypothetical protein DFJ73DRAFT_868323 [Zopfochytrium polystomum]|nr:hypothetical protein DFJ73DRAFT_868323 [Zopfochytrium polystomum]
MSPSRNDGSGPSPLRPHRASLLVNLRLTALLSLLLSFFVTSEPVVAADAEPGIAAASFCDANNQFCVHARRYSATETVTFCVQSTLTGWMGLGIGGSTMATSTIYVIYSNGSGGVTISERTTVGNNEPVLSSSQNFVISQDPLTVPSWAIALPSARVVASFNRSTVPAKGNAVSTTGATSFIWAVSQITPSDPASPSSRFTQHSDNGAFAMDLSAVGTVTAGVSQSLAVIWDVRTLRTVHGVCMFLAWGVFPPVAVLVARHFKARLGHTWYILHVALLLIGTGLITALGLVFIELQVPSSSTRLIGASGADPHKPIGTVVAFVLFPLQIVLGFISNALFSPDRPSIPWWDRLHWWVGRAVMVLAVVEIYLGLRLFGASTAVVVAYWVWIGVCVAAFAAAQLLGGAVHHLEGQLSSKAA